MRHLARTGVLLAALLYIAAPAQAHVVASRLGDFYSGALHPLTDLQEVILWAALGALAGSFGDGRGRWLVAVFPLGLLVGFGAGVVFEITTGGMIVDAAAMLVLGLLMATAMPLSAIALCALAGLLAVLRGLAAASGVTPETDLTLFAAGFGAAGYATVTLVAAAALTFRGPRTAGAGWRPVAMCACGSWIAAVGLMLGGFALAS